MGKLKGQLDVVVPDNLFELGVAPAAIVENRLVHHVPSFYTSLVATYQRVNVVFHPFNHHLARHILPLFVDEEPVGCL
ncbi:hypothetical protein SDC9_201383 [bioreactor metagenome]|uniref:Uncharacterized protein n=1 Tax=bioreactor metagenome TaxID=1076179 RepID=A0A645IR67_9ZZZZ